MIVEARFRPATIEDCYDIARLFKIASGGVAEYTWTTMQVDYPGLSPIEIGERRSLCLCSSRTRMLCASTNATVLRPLIVPR